MDDDFFDAFKAQPKSKHNTKVVHFRKEDYDVFIARPSKWGCPFTIIKDRSTRAEYVVGSRKELFEKYEDWLENGDGKHLLNDLHELKDKRLGCWCKDLGGKGKKCHGDILVKLIEKYCI
jgi:isoleucyl-tRNA synthetase